MNEIEKAEIIWEPEPFCSAKEFLDCLRPTNSHWSGPHESWIFRGQRNEKWGLVPKAYRKDIHLSYQDQSIKGPVDNFEDQVKHEYQAILDFVLKARECRLKIPGDSYSFGTFNNIIDMYDVFWPKEEFMEIVAIAQHQGVPTRLLDFTKDSYIAAFFAGLYAYQYEQGHSKKKMSDYIAVWAINRAFIEWTPCQQKLGIHSIEVPGKDNDFLQTQKALFLWDSLINSQWKKYRKMPQSSIDIWEKIRGFKEREIWNRWKQERNQNYMLQPVAKILLKWDQIKSLLTLLSKEGIKESVLMPAYQNIIKTLILEKELGISYHTNF